MFSFFQVLDLQYVFLVNVVKVFLKSNLNSTTGVYLVFRILILCVLSVNKIYIEHPQFFLTVLKCPKIEGANSLCIKIAGAKAPIVPVLNTP